MSKRTVTFDGEFIRVRKRVSKKAISATNSSCRSRSKSKDSHSSGSIPSTCESSRGEETSKPVLVTPSGVRLPPPSSLDATNEYVTMRSNLQNVEKKHLGGIKRCTAKCDMEHSINTIGSEAMLVADKHLDIEILHELLMKPEVVEYNRMRNVFPTVNLRRFNQARGILISGRGHLSKNCIHAKFFKTMKIQVAGPRSIDELESILEYLRGMVAAMLGCHVRIDKPILHNINSGLQLKCKIDRMLLTEELQSTMLDAMLGSYNESSHRNVEYDPEGKKKYAGVKLRVYSGDEHNMPSLLVFHTGYIMIMARSFEIMELAVKYVCKLSASGIFNRTLLTESASSDDALALHSIRNMIMNEISGDDDVSRAAAMTPSATAPMIVSEDDVSRVAAAPTVIPCATAAPMIPSQVKMTPTAPATEVQEPETELDIFDDVLRWMTMDQDFF